MPVEIDLPEEMRKIGELVRQIEAEAPAARSRSVELMTRLMDVHAAGLERILALVDQAGGNQGLLDEFAADPLVRSLLLLYGLHPVALETRVAQSLDKVRPYLKSHGGNVELLGIEEGTVRLRLTGSCHGCPSSAMTLKNAIEEAIFEFAPDVAELQVDGALPSGPPGPFISLESVVAAGSGGK